MNSRDVVAPRRAATTSARRGTLPVLLALAAMAVIGAAGIWIGRQRLDERIDHRADDRAALVERFADAGDRLYDPARTLDLIDQTPFLDLVDSLNEAALDLFQVTATSDPLTGAALVRLDGTVLASRPRDLELPTDVLAPTLHPAVRGMVLTLRDRTDRQALEDRLRDRATNDPLTGLPNRSAFARALEALDRPAAAVEAPTAAILFVDLDRFKPINDVHGHQVGDEVLVEVADRLREVVGDEGLVARHGGDEFTILLRDPDQARAEELTARLLDAVRRPIHVGSLDLQLGASAGLVLAHGPTSVGHLIRSADHAMYEAKRGGRDRWTVEHLAPSA